MHTRAGRTSRRMEAHSQLWHKIRPLTQCHAALAFGAVALIISSFIIVSVLNTPQKSMDTKIAAYSIWAVPSHNGSHRLSLNNLINAMSRKYGTYPFAPHVTVIGSFGPELGLTDEAAVAGMKYLSHLLKPYDMEVMDIASGHEYFRCVYLRMVKSKQVRYDATCHFTPLASRHLQPDTYTPYTRAARIYDEVVKRIRMYFFA